MSYYGIKNLKTVKKENNLYNVSADYYDSSIRDYNGNRVWYHADSLFTEDYCKEDLEWKLFKNFLDGNFHTSGNCGKYQSLSWTNFKIQLSEEDSIKVKELETKYYENINATNNKELRSNYYDTRYRLYFKTWKQYLYNESQKKKQPKFIINIIKTDGNYYVTKQRAGILTLTTEVKKAKKYEEENANLLSSLINKKSLYDIKEVKVIPS